MKLAPALLVAIRLVHPGLIPEDVLNRGEQIAAHILQSAGVEVEWRECAKCAREFRVHLIDRRPPHAHSDCAGFAVLMDGESYAGVYVREVERSAADLGRDSAEMLGATLAHEIGHLLLGRRSHAKSGVMQARLRGAELRQAGRGELRFTAEERGAIHSSLAGRGSVGAGK